MRVGASYVAMLAPSWSLDGEYDLAGVPGSVKGNGLMLQAGIFVGTFYPARQSARLGTHLAGGPGNLAARYIFSLNCCSFHAAKNCSHVPRWYFPVEVTGTSVPRTTTFGALANGRCRLQCSRMFCSVSMRPFLQDDIGAHFLAVPVVRESDGDAGLHAVEVHQHLVDLER